MSVRRAKQEIDALEFQQWLLLEEMEPFGDDWLQAGVIASALGGGAPKDYIPKVEPPQDPRTIERAMIAHATRHNANLKRR